MAIYQYPNRRDERPSTQIEIDTSAVTGSAIDSTKTLMIVGPAHDGKPDTVYRVRNMHQAQSIFRGGELLDALQMAWNPSVESRGAGDILAMRVEDASGAKLTKEGITFHSKLYGEEANNIEIGLEEVSLGGVETRNFVVQFAPDNYKEVYRNIDNAILLSRDDSITAATVEVTTNQLTITVTTETGDTATPITLGTGGAATVNGLVGVLNNIQGIKASIPLGGNRNINTLGLEPMSPTDIPDEGSVAVNATVANIANQLAYNPYIEVEIPESMLDEQGNVTEGTLQSFAVEPLEGGKQGTVPTSWINKFSQFANEGGYYLVPLTDSQTVHAEAASFVKERTDNAEPMRTIVGAGYDESVDQLLNRARTLASPRAMLIGYSGHYAYPDGRVAKTPSYMFAAQVAGLAAGLEIGEAVTFKDVNLTDLATVYSPTELDVLNSSGVVMAEFVRNGRQEKFRLVDDVTTFADPYDPVNSQMGVGEGSDFLVSELKIMLDESYIGTKVINISSSLIKNSVQSFLDQKKRDREIQDYNPEDVQVVINGEVANISLVVYPIRSLKKIEVSLVYNTQTIEA